ncbi:leucine-rich repeat-containing protein 4C [Episyrphus balteatus]|uniref:leucine-rich repeat-containing protein 4C n=1 Tax=Episyrphus balteatus TaxID=286459 RepID=UPI0024864519|nr:leucine-rich repeat-containing protein 4C [Episyrphus balteatus]
MLQHPPWQWLLLTLILLKQADSFCPSKCQCMGGDSNSQAYCVNAALEDVPIQLNPETKYINLTLNKIRNVEFTLPFYMKLEVLDLSQNIIETLGSKNFEYQSEMRTLNLSGNSVSSLNKDAFKGLTNLLLLDLSFNRIEVVHPTAMNDLTSLIELDLTNNLIVSLEDGVFRNMISLEILIFKNNQLLDVPASNLVHLHALKSLDLSVNLIEFVRNDSFEGLRDLMMVNLRGNVISELDLSSFDGLSALKQMDMADNNLTIVPTQQLSKLSNLTHLSLSGNRFTHIPAVALLNLFHLRELHLNRLDRLVKIDSRAFVDNTHLQSFDLNYNPLFSDLPMRLFQGNPNIMDISMQGNNLQTLDAAQFPVDRIQRLYLGDNPLQCNCSLLWLWRLVTGNFDEPTSQKPASNSTHPDSSSSYLKLDNDRISCDIWQDNIRTRRLLHSMSESEITCPAHIVTIVCAILTCLVVVMTGASVVFYLRFVKRRRKLLQDRRAVKAVVNVHDRIMQQHPSHHHFQSHPQVDKLELERYLAAQAIANEYRALKPWELPVKEALDEPEHLYEKFDHYEYPDTHTMTKPHVVYV